MRFRGDAFCKRSVEQDRVFELIAPQPLLAGRACCFDENDVRAKRSFDANAIAECTSINDQIANPVERVEVAIEENAGGVATNQRIG